MAENRKKYGKNSWKMQYQKRTLTLDGLSENIPFCGPFFILKDFNKEPCQEKTLLYTQL